MSRTRAILVLLTGLGVLGQMVPRAAADEWDQKTIFTFNGPVEIPGQVLPAGTYVFKLADSSSDRNVVQVFSNDEKHLYGTFLSIPDQRLLPAGKPIITFEERAAGSPEAVRAWFYPGDDYGHHFVYPKPKALALAKANDTPVPSMPAELAANTTKPAATVNEPHVAAMKQAHLKAQKPTEEEVEIAEVFVAQAVPPDQAQLPAELPQTGSPLPLISLVGLLSLGAALGLRFAAARAKQF
jgi:LPXTG-motif cell wall-anchored protein